jgi:hypothetical protein
MPLMGLVLEQHRCCAAAALSGSAPGRPRCRSRSFRRTGGQSRGSRTSSTPLARPCKLSAQVHAQRPDVPPPRQNRCRCTLSSPPPYLGSGQYLNRLRARRAMAPSGALTTSRSHNRTCRRVSQGVTSGTRTSRMTRAAGMGAIALPAILRDVRMGGCLAVGSDHTV